MPEGARGKFSSYDGDAFLVNIPPRVTGALSAEQVYGEIVKPLVNAMGYGSRAGDLRAGSPQGNTLPKANLAALATETCKEFEGEKYQRFHPVCEALSKGGTNEVAERVLQVAYGMSVAQFRADAERPRIHYTFLQQVEKVPIEHATVVAERNDGETVTAVYGTIFNRYGITNANKLSPDAAVDTGQSHVFKFKGMNQKRPDVRSKPSVLVLLPYGSAPDGSIGLKYAYRTLIYASIAGKPDKGFLSWMAWIDAENGRLLQLAPQFDDIAAVGMTWKRDPNTTTQVHGFQVDAASGGQYTLQLSGVFDRIDRFGDGNFDDDEVSISDSTNGSSATLANFNQAPINDPTNALCAAGGNNTFRQVNAFAHLSSFRNTLISAGTFPTFPEAATTIKIDLPQSSNSAGYDTMGSDGKGRINLGTGLTGFTDAACPDVPDGVMPGSTDATPLAHEFMHNGTKRLQERRPADWCGMAPCSVPNPTVRLSFHDYTDAWAQAYASTPCMGGWYRKNMGGADVSENCASHNEGGGLPRLASVSEPFNTATILDHFPERRATLTGGYEDMHINAAALWLTRQGMRSKCLPSGTPQYWLRINRALYNSGFVTSTCANCDRDIYLFSQNFAQQMTQQWATAGQPGGPPGFAHNGAHTTNKLLSAWARVGIFLIPFSCIDGDAATGDPTFCPVASGGENGGDAIGDVFDNDAADDVVIDQITHVEMDWIKRGGPLPTFRVWTGPRFKFNAAGVASGYTPSPGTPSPCNSKFRVEMASDEAFTVNLIEGPWTNVSTTAQPECYGTWQPDPADWTTLGGATGNVKVYYRIRTRDAADVNEKLSTSPGSGSYAVPPSYVVVNDAGQP